MRVKFLRDFGGDNTLGVMYLAGAVVELPDVNALGLLRRGGVVELIYEGPKAYSHSTGVVKVVEEEEEIPAVPAKVKGRKR